MEHPIRSCHLLGRRGHRWHSCWVGKRWSIFAWAKLTQNQWPKITYIPYRVLGRSSRFGFCWIYVIVCTIRVTLDGQNKLMANVTSAVPWRCEARVEWGTNCHRRRKGRRPLLLRTAMRFRSMPLAHAWYPAPMYRPTPNALRPARGLATSPPTTPATLSYFIGREAFIGRWVTKLAETLWKSK